MFSNLENSILGNHFAAGASVLSVGSSHGLAIVMFSSIRRLTSSHCTAGGVNIKRGAFGGKAWQDRFQFPSVRLLIHGGKADMARRLISWGLVALAVAGLSTTAHAQRYGRTYGPAMTPFGPVYNPALSPEWRQAGGNPIIYEQIMQQKALIQQQKLMMQQQQAYNKYQQELAKQKKANGNTTTGTTSGDQPQAFSTTLTPPRRKTSTKKSATSSSPSTPTSTPSSTKTTTTPANSSSNNATTTGKPTGN
jgi:hypothetical protein